jgi:hypothetical protein
MRTKPANMTNEQWAAYKARTARRAAAAAALANLPPAPIEVKVGVMTAKIDAGADQEFGTSDDKVSILSSTSLDSMSKAELLALAEERGIEVPQKANKEKLLKALRNAH